MPNSDTPLMHYRHIVIEGPIGVGKSSLARRLARHLHTEPMLERAEDNPFLERFYDDAPGYAFQTQLFFLFQRLRQVREQAQPGMFEPVVVSDFMFAKDAMFARINLSDEEYHLYAQMYAQLALQVPQPDLVVWLQASPPTLLRRIEQRAIAMEQRISGEYLQSLCDAYTDHFRHYEGAPVFAVDTEHFDPSGCDADFALLVERLAALQDRREFLQPRVGVALT